MVVIVLYGPKGAGKSEVAAVLSAAYGVVHVDADDLVLRLLATGAEPHPDHGWLDAVEEEVRAALATSAAVSVEATGAWESDWQHGDDFEADGARVLRVWIDAPVHVTLQRLATRPARKVPVTPSEARRLYAAAHAEAEHRRFDLRIDTARLTAADLPEAVSALAPLLVPSN